MKSAFTITELLVVIGIIVILAVLAVPALHDFQLTSDLENSADQILNILRLARQKTIASELASSWGVYFSTSTSPHQYTLFKGQAYISRDAIFDEIHKLPKSVEIYRMDFSEGKQEAVFQRITGMAQPGTIYLRLKNDPPKNIIINIGNFGQIWAE